MANHPQPKRMLFKFGRGMRGIRDSAPARAYPAADSTAAGVVGAASAVNDTAATFARATGAWNPRTNSIVGANVRRRDSVSIGGRTYQSDLIEGARTNLLAVGTSDQFATGWTLDSSDLTYTGAQSGPSADLPATMAVETLTTSGRVIFGQNITKAASPVQYTGSVYLKPLAVGATRFVLVTISDNAGNGAQTVINLSTGVLSLTSAYGGTPFTSVSGQVATVGGGWYRVSVTATSNSATTVRLDPQLRETAGVFSYTGDGVSGVYFAGACVEAAAFPSSHVSNRNLLTYSEVIDDASWSKTRSSVSANSVINPIDGTLTADTIIDTVDANTQHYFSKAVSKAASSLTYTFSAYGRRKERDFVLRVTDTGFTNGCRAFFNLSTGALISSDAFGAGFAIVGTPSATSVIASDGSQWYRCQITVTTDTSAFIRAAIELIEAGIADDTYTGDGTSGVYVYGLQLEYGSTATTYWCNQTASGVRNSDVLTNSLVGFTDSRTNRITYSDQFDNAAYTNTSITVAANSVADPLYGVAVADTLTRSATGVACSLYQTHATTSGVQYVVSCYVKANTTGNQFGLRIQNTYPARTGAVFNLANGTVRGTEVDSWTNTGAGITALSGGWYRVYVTGLSNASLAGARVYLGPTDSSAAVTGWEGATTSLADCYAFGLQVEIGSTPGEYLPTGATAAASGFTGTSVTNGSLYTVFRPYGWTGDQDGSTSFMLFNSENPAGYPRIIRNNTTSYNVNHRDQSTGIQSVTVAHGITNGTRLSEALTWTPALMTAYHNGASAGSDVPAAAGWDNATSIVIGNWSSATRAAHGYVLLLYWHGRTLTSQHVAGLWAGTSR
jgi:hypothetical protein